MGSLLSKPKKYVFFADVPRIITKQYLRKPLIDKLHAGREEDIKNFVDYMTRNSVQKMLQEYVANLKKKSEAKK